MQRALLLAVAAWALACDPSVPRPRLDPGLERRLGQARAEAASRTEALVDLGRLELEAEQWFAAAETLLRAREQGFDTAPTLGGLAFAYVRLGYVGSAVEALRSCFRKAPGYPDCLYAFGILLERDPNDGAQRELQRNWARFLLVSAPNDPRRSYAESMLAQLTARFGPLTEQDIRGGPPPENGAPSPERTESPEAPPSSAGAPHPPPGEGSAGPLNPFGQALQRAFRALAEENPTEAIAAFEEALGLQPDDPPTLAGLAEAQLAAGRAEDAVASVEKAWAADPSDPQVRYAFGRVMLQLERRGEEALAAWQALLTDTPDYARRLGVDRVLEEGVKAPPPPAEAAPDSATEPAPSPREPEPAKTPSPQDPDPAPTTTP